MRLGVPYKGSKSRIAERIIADLPSADTFVDLFAGGCAVTHAAMLSGKYDNYIVNDIDGRGVRLFRDAVDGRYDTLPDKWVSRADFLANKALPVDEQDPYIAVCWSFGNNMKDYLYSKDIEEWKHAFHEAVFHNDLTLWRGMGFDAPECGLTDVTERLLFYGAAIRERERAARKAPTSGRTRLPVFIRQSGMGGGYTDSNTGNERRTRTSNIFSGGGGSKRLYKLKSAERYPRRAEGICFFLSAPMRKWMCLIGALSTATSPTKGPTSAVTAR